MGDKSRIEWTDATWNPVVGCTKVSQGCKHCYAKTLHDMRRRAYLDGKKVPAQYAEPFETVQCLPQRLEMPIRWKRPRMIFVNSVSDLFHEDVPFEFIAQVFDVMADARCEQHTFQVLTKRIERVQVFLWWLGNNWPGDSPVNTNLEVLGNFGPNIWLGVSVEDQGNADLRIPCLLNAPAAVRFLSCEPLLGPVDLCKIPYVREGFVLASTLTGPVYINPLLGYRDNAVDRRIDWVIVGGESGAEARAMHSNWARELRDQCQVADVPFFFKQWGEWIPNNQVIDWPKILGRKYHPWKDGGGSLWVGKERAGHLLDGVEWRQMPNG